jgi:hypothetical protein
MVYFSICSRLEPEQIVEGLLAGAADGDGSVGWICAPGGAIATRSDGLNRHRTCF